MADVNVSPLTYILYTLVEPNVNNPLNNDIGIVIVHIIVEPDAGTYFILVISVLLDGSPTGLGIFRLAHNILFLPVPFLCNILYVLPCGIVYQFILVLPDPNLLKYLVEEFAVLVNAILFLLLPVRYRYDIY